MPSCFIHRCALYLLRFLVTVMVILMYIGSGVAIYFTVDWTTDCPSVESSSDVAEGDYHIYTLQYSSCEETCCVAL